ncbi:MAG TPA: beta-propeller fold lactonase family protein [Candidatus Cybelea sp.]
MIAHERVFNELAGKEFLYVANSEERTITAYEIDVDGSLRPVKGSPFKTRGPTRSLAATPQGTFLYASDQNYPPPNLGFVLAYAIDANSGALTPVKGSPFQTKGGEPFDLAVDATGTHLYASNTYANSMLGYEIAENGTITPIHGEPFPAGAQPEHISIDLDGGFLYAGNTEVPSISEYAVSPSTGGLSQIPGSPLSLSEAHAPFANAIAIDAEDQVLYVSNARDNGLFPFKVNASTGTLSLIGDLFPDTALPSDATTTIDGRFLYVVNQGSNNVSGYQIRGSMGQLTAIKNSPFAAGKSPAGIVVSRDGRFLYVLNSGSADIFAYDIDSDTGVLTKIPSPTFPVGKGPIAIALAHAPAPSPGNVYVADSNGVKEVLASGGYTTVKDIGAEFGRASGVAVDGVGHVDVADSANNLIKQISVESGYKNPQPIGPRFRGMRANALAGVTGVTADASGNLFLTESLNGKQGANVYEIKAIAGVIPSVPIATKLGSGYDSPMGIAVDSKGDVYVADDGNGVVKELVAVDGAIPAMPAVRILGGTMFSAHCYDCGGPNGPYGVAVDGKGDVFVADTVHKSVKELVAVRGVVPDSPEILTLGTTFGNPVSVALDLKGDLFVVDQQYKAVREIVAVGGKIPQRPTTVTIGARFNDPVAVVVR